jgi:hypothetical protein
MAEVLRNIIYGKHACREISRGVRWPACNASYLADARTTAGSAPNQANNSSFVSKGGHSFAVRYTFKQRPVSLRGAAMKALAMGIAMAALSATSAIAQFNPFSYNYPFFGLPYGSLCGAGPVTRITTSLRAAIATEPMDNAKAQESRHFIKWSKTNGQYCPTFFQARCRPDLFAINISILAPPPNAPPPNSSRRRRSANSSRLNKRDYFEPAL